MWLSNQHHTAIPRRLPLGHKLEARSQAPAGFTDKVTKMALIIGQNRDAALYFAANTLQIALHNLSCLRPEMIYLAIQVLVYRKRKSMQKDSYEKIIKLRLV